VKEVEEELREKKEKDCHYCLYLAPENFISECEKEAKVKNFKDVHVFGRLLLTTTYDPYFVWCDEIYQEAFFLDIESINHASKSLRPFAKEWVNGSEEFFRRGELIAEGLRRKKNDLSHYPDFWEERKGGEYGTYFLITKDKLLVGLKPTTPYALGKMLFVEDKIGPPSRAYLKLWNFFSLTQTWPKKSDFAIDLGACPGGWTWVMSESGCRVLSLDKAPLDEKLMKHPDIEYRAMSAFALKPNDIEEESIDWLLSDVICYPERLVPLAHMWVASGKVRRIVFTIKFQGETDHDSLAKLLSIPHSYARHLYCNKHEVTWYWSQDHSLKAARAYS
jgi:23S rRNA (cytidine2498-2'-O)-methyltransferase